MKAKTNQANAMKVKCPLCAANRGESCRGPHGGRRPVHRERYRKEREVRRARLRSLKRARAQRGRRMEGVIVRFECPVCGGDHSRVDHVKAKGAAGSMISQALALSAVDKARRED